MPLPNVESLHTQPPAVQSKSPLPGLKSSEKLNKIQRIGMRFLLLGMTPENFAGPTTLRSISVWIFLSLFQTAFATYEAAVSLFLSRNLLEMISHGYIATYMYAFNTQWFYMLTIIPKIHSNPIRFEDFHCSKFHDGSVQRIIDDNTNYLFKILIFSICWWTFNSQTHVLGPAIEAVVTFITQGYFEEVFMLPQVFQLPLWAQIMIYPLNAISMWSLLVYCSASYSVMCVQVAKIKALCEILTEALASDFTSKEDVRAYVKDHCTIIQRAKELTHQLENLNSFMFTACYLEFATQMFVMTLFDPSGSYYAATALDLLSIFLILVLQCFMGTQITESLHSLANGPYFSKWYDKDKEYRQLVQLTTQMAQKPFEQVIWMGSQKVERATSLSLLKSSYAAYTILMIFQKSDGPK